MKPFDFMNEKYHMGHMFLDSVRSRPTAINQIDAATGESESNASVLRRVVQFARCLRRWGAVPGDVLALGGRNHLDLNIPYYAALLNGMPIAGVDPLFKYTELKSHFKVSLPKVVFCQKEDIADHLQAIQDLELDTKLICFDEGEYSMKRFIQEYDDPVDSGDFEPLDFDQNKIYAWLVSTGGTTGVLKLAAFKHKTFLEKMLQFQEFFQKNNNDVIDNGENKHALHLSPVQWISGFFNTACFPLMRLAKVQTSAPATTEHVIDIINKYKPVTAMLGPSTVTAILKSEKKCDFTCFNNILLTGSKVHKDIHLQIRKRMRPGAQVAEMYGQTENLGPALTINTEGPIGNCGSAPVKQQKIKLVDPETGREINEPNVKREMWTKGPNLSEYYRNPEETARAFTEDGWYRTGDILYADENGNYFFVERINMLIKYRNYHIVPTELEAVLRSHPGVQDVSVTSVPHDEDGEHAVACVVRNHRVPVTAQDIKDLIASKLSDTQRLRGGVVFMDKLPVTSTMKVARGKLRQMVATAHRE